MLLVWRDGAALEYLSRALWLGVQRTGDRGFSPILDAIRSSDLVILKLDIDSQS